MGKINCLWKKLSSIKFLSLLRKFYQRGSWIQHKKVTLVIISVMLLLSSMGVYMMLSIIEVDPSWSLKLAKKHCQSSNRIYIDTTPFYAKVLRSCSWSFSLWLPDHGCIHLSVLFNQVSNTVCASWPRTSGQPGSQKHSKRAIEQFLRDGVFVKHGLCYYCCEMLSVIVFF